MMSTFHDSSFSSMTGLAVWVIPILKIKIVGTGVVRDPDQNPDQETRIALSSHISHILR
jgi:hypothetical protein